MQHKPVRIPHEGVNLAIQLFRRGIISKEELQKRVRQLQPRKQPQRKTFLMPRGTR